MSLLAYVPGTHEHAKRKHAAYTAKLQKGHDVLCELEWEDGTVSYEPGDWKHEYSAVKTANTDLYFFARGQGSRKHDFAGATVVNCHVPNTGLISTEAAIAADRRDQGAERKVTESGAVLEQTDDGEWVRVDGDQDREEVAADGGTVDIEQCEIADKLLPMAPPSATVTRYEDGDVDMEVEFDYDGEVMSWKTASDYDPNPVTQNDLQALFETVRNAETDQEMALKWAAVGLGAGVCIVLGIFTLLWLKGKIDGGSGGGVDVAIMAGAGRMALQTMLVGLGMG